MGWPLRIRQSAMQSDHNWLCHTGFIYSDNAIPCTRPCRADHITFEDVKAEYATGKSFVHEQLDTFGRPVLIIRANKHNPSECCCFSQT
jgi:hypothetical protein